MTADPRSLYPRPPFGTTPQPAPGSSARMSPEPIYGEKTYVGSAKVEGRVALITGADSGFGRAVVGFSPPLQRQRRPVPGYWPPGHMARLV